MIDREESENIFEGEFEDEERNIASPEDIGTHFLDKEVRYLVDVEYVAPVPVGRAGNISPTTRKEVRTFAVAGSYLSTEMMKEAMELVEKYPDLNEPNRIGINKPIHPTLRIK